MQLWPPKWLPFVQEKKESSKEKPKDPLELLLENCHKHLKTVRDKLIIRAYHINKEAYGSKVRKSGESFYAHPLAVANIVAGEIPLDDTSVIVALLHDIPIESDKYTIEDIRSEFGSYIADLVDGVSKIQTIETHSPAHLENYRKLLVSLFKDVRIILIKIADRLHNMKTLDYLEPAKQKRIAEETLEIYAPFAHRFGIGNAKWQLEDLSFKYLNPTTFDEINRALQLKREEREEYIRSFTKPIIHTMNNNELFKANNTLFEISGRAKHIYSIFNKTIIREKPMDELYDLFAIRIILETDDTNYCFITYGIISKLYRQVPETFKNYISQPKKNGYQSLHVAFFGVDNKPVEVQIRTRNMHEVAEKGVAAHFNYKRGTLPENSFLETKNIEDWMESVRQIFETAASEPTGDFLEKLRINLQLDEIYVFTPSDEFRVLPKDSSPLDFAFAVHSNLGFSCIGAKINGKIVPLNYKLNSGDKVEILTSKNTKPKKEWLGYVVTTKARTAILKYLKEELKKKISSGKSTLAAWNKEFPNELTNKQINKIIEVMGYLNEEEFLCAIHDDIIDKEQILKIVLSKLNNHKIDNQKEAETCELKEFDAPVVFATCCHPVRGDKIYGIMNDGKNVEVHRSECKKYIKMMKELNSAKFNIEWYSLPDEIFTSKIKITANDTSEVISEITSNILLLADTRLKSINFSTKDNYITGHLTIQVRNNQQINKLIETLESIKDVKKVDRVLD